MLDSTTALAYSMFHNKGVYALLLGSGASSGAGIPTGWDITLDMIRKVASAEGADAGGDPVGWLKQNKGIDPDYSVLLDQLARTPSERRRVLGSYIEANDDERAEGRKAPTAAHRAIAEMVRAGYIRVILTTNFDRLLETALRDAGVEPTVISTDDSALGAEPITHARCTIIKVHGDYLDTRIKNTESELVSYSPAMNALLDRVFEDFGIIVCGWSATWDQALRDAITRVISRRYSLYWACVGKLSGEAEGVIASRKGNILQCDSADTFFSELNEKLRSLEDLSKPHPLSPALAVAAVKRYVVDEASRIKLNDLVEDVLEEAIRNIPEEALAPSGGIHTDDFRKRFAAYENALATLLPVLATGARWSTRSPSQWLVAIERLLALETQRGGTVVLLDLRRYPALLAFYAIGVGAVVGRNFELLKALLYAPVVGGRDKKSVFLTKIMNTFSVAPKEVQQMLPGMEKRKYPFSDHFFELLATLLPRDVTAGDFETAFDTFELLISLSYADREMGPNPKEDEIWAPTGRYAYKEAGVLQDTQFDFAERAAEWPWYQAGLFSGDQVRAKVLADGLAHLTRRQRF